MGQENRRKCDAVRNGAAHGGQSGSREQAESLQDGGDKNEYGTPKKLRLHLRNQRLGGQISSRTIVHRFGA